LQQSCSEEEGWGVSVGGKED